MSRQPKPAKGGADAHRQQDREEDDEDEYMDAITPQGPSPGDRDGGGGGSGGGGQPPASPGSSGMLDGFPVRKVALVGGALIAAYILWKLVQEGAINVENSSNDDADGGQPTEDDLVEDDPTDVVIQQRPEDPLAADHEAGQFVFGWDS